MRTDMDNAGSVETQSIEMSPSPSPSPSSNVDDNELQVTVDYTFPKSQRRETQGKLRYMKISISN